MQADTDIPSSPAFRPPLHNVRWGAVAGGLVVLIGVGLLLFLLEGTASLAVVGARAFPGRAPIPTAAGLGGVACGFIAALAGGYAAARAAGMRRTADGMLHGALAWGAALLVCALLIALAGAAAGERLGAVRRAADAQAAQAVDPDQRLALADTLQRRLGLTAEEADSVVDQIAALSRAEPMAQAGVTARALHKASAFGSWLSAGLLASLLGAVGGGALGSRDARRPRLPAGRRAE